MASHTRTLLSQLPLTRRVPSGEKATDATLSPCPSYLEISLPEVASHTRTLLSPLPLTRRVPSGEKATDYTRPECPSSFEISKLDGHDEHGASVALPPDGSRLVSGCGGKSVCVSSFGSVIGSTTRVYPVDCIDFALGDEWLAFFDRVRSGRVAVRGDDRAWAVGSCVFVRRGPIVGVDFVTSVVIDARGKPLHVHGKPVGRVVSFPGRDIPGMIWCVTGSDE